MKNFLKFPALFLGLFLAAASLSGCVASSGTAVVVGSDPYYYRPYPRPYYRPYPRPYYRPRPVIVTPAPRPYYHSHGHSVRPYGPRRGR